MTESQQDTPQRPIVVTGGASGIGRAITLRLLDLGHPVGVLDLDEAGLTALAAEAPGKPLHRYVADITDYAAVEQAVAGFADAAGEPFGLVNNAGWDRAMPFVETEPPFWRTRRRCSARTSARVSSASCTSPWWAARYQAL